MGVFLDIFFLGVLMNWIIPFNGRGVSGACNQNFLCKFGSIYIMDNHRAALWCWLDFYGGNISDVSVFHLDRHSDTLLSNLGSWVTQASAPVHVKDMGIQQYLDTTDSCVDPAFPSKLFTWGNYLSIFLSMYGSNIRKVICSIYEGDEINYPAVIQVSPWDIPENLGFWLKDGKWIVNVDLDYFFCKGEADYFCMYSNSFIESFFSGVAKIAQQNKETVVTISFSPECCGGGLKLKRHGGLLSQF